MLTRGDTPASLSRWIGRLCAGGALLAAAAVFAAGLYWAKQNPRPTYWDEAGYFNSAAVDYWALKDRRPLKKRVEAIVKEGLGQPPAHRVAIVLTYFFGLKSMLLRGISLAALLGAALFLYNTGRYLAGVGAGALAALALLVSPTVVASSIRFGSEYPIYLTTAAMLYFLLSTWGSATPRRYTQLGLAAAIGAGLWSKPSFLTIAVPMLAVALLVSYRKLVIGPAPAWIWRAVLLGAVAGAVYWLPFGSRTFRYVRRASVFDRHSLGGHSLHTLLTYLSIVASTALGPIVTVLAAIAFLVAATRLLLRRGQIGPGGADVWAVVLCLAGVVPFAVVQFFSENHDIRLLSPVMVPLALAFGIATARIAFVRVPALNAVFAAGLLAQLGMMLAPLRGDPAALYAEFGRRAVVGNTGDSVATVFAPTEQWNWDELRQFAQTHALSAPLISYVGNGDPFNRMEIVQPWVRRDEPVTATWLWPYEKGSIRWNDVMADADDHSDIVLTAPGYQGLHADKQEYDNVHNAEFARRLENDSNFERPVRLKFGKYDPATVLVFLNKRAGHLTPPPKEDRAANAASNGPAS